MNPDTGQLYTPREVAAMIDGERAELVEIRGTLEQVTRVSEAVARSHRADKAKAKRRKASQASRRANRGER